jgi:hypothetical protein
VDDSVLGKAGGVCRFLLRANKGAVVVLSAHLDADLDRDHHEQP